MSAYIETRFRLTQNGWVVEALNAITNKWQELHVYKNPYPSNDKFSNLMRALAKCEACMLALDLSRHNPEKIICYDENNQIAAVYKHAVNVTSVYAQKA